MGIMFMINGVWSNEKSAHILLCKVRAVENEGSCVIMTIQDHPKGCNLHVSIMIVLHCCCFLLSELNYISVGTLTHIKNTHTHTGWEYGLSGAPADR